MAIKRNLILATIATVMSTMSAATPGILPGLADYETKVMRPKSPSHLTYMPDGESYLMLSSDRKKILSYETATGKEIGTILDVTHTRETSIDRIGGFSLSPNGKKLLVYESAEPIYRYSVKAAYYVFEISRNILLPLSTNHPTQISPVFSPDARMVAFVSDNNIYLKKLDFNTETAVTTDGAENQIINGIPDWVYQEEFSTICSMIWSPDNTTLVYLKYNETDVPLYTFPLYEGVCPSLSEYALYPGIFSYKYPLPGVTNSKVTLHSFDIDNRKTKDIVFDDPNIEYIPSIQYGGKTDPRVIVTTLNRDQNRMEVYSVNPKSTVIKSLLVEKPDAWVLPESYENLTLLDESFVIFSPRSGYTHLYEYSYNGTLLRSITSGDYDVTDYYGCDVQGNHYYRSTCSGAINRVVSRIDIKNKITDLSPVEGVSSASFSPALNYFVLSNSTVSHAPVYKLFNSKLKELRTLEDNAGVTARYASLPVREFFTIPSAAGNLSLEAYMIKPSNFNSSKKYPVILWQYSGPGASQVMNSWSIGWQQYAAVEQGYIVVCVDPRGSAGKGYSFMTSVYKHLGINETADQCAAARYLASLPYVDGNKIGIAGWSFGGYETLMAVSAKNSPFVAGVAVAPVTSWRYYDSIYTERYMLTPQQNSEGYFSSSPVNLTDDMNSALLIMSGTADDNVHFSNTVEYLAHLQGSGKLCNLMIFPNKNHSIFGCNARELVYSNMIIHFNNNLK